MRALADASSCLKGLLSSEDINVLESKALLNALVAFGARLSNTRVDVHIDSRVLNKSALDSDGCKSSTINDVVKDIFHHSRDFNFSIQTFYVPSSQSQQMNLHGIYLTSIVCSPPRHGCA